MPWVVIGQELLEDLGNKTAFHLAKETHDWLTGKHHVGQLFGRDVLYDHLNTSFTIKASQLRHAHLRPSPLPPHIANLSIEASPALLKYIDEAGRLCRDALNWTREALPYISSPPEPRVPGDCRTFRMTSDFSVVFGDLETNFDTHGEDAAGSIILIYTPESEHEFHSNSSLLSAAAETLEENREWFRKQEKPFYFVKEKENGELGVFRTPVK